MPFISEPGKARNLLLGARTSSSAMSEANGFARLALRLRTRTSARPVVCGALLVLLLLLQAALVSSVTSQDVSKLQARSPRDWVRNGVIYEVYPRAFSEQGNFNGVTAQLDRLRELGVTIVWLMPIHPIGQEKKKGAIGSPYAVRD